MGLRSFLFPRKKTIWADMDNGINQIKHGIYLRLMNRYLEKHGEDVSGLLAASVTNELFSVPPVNEDARNFLHTKRSLIDDEMVALKNDGEILTAATHAMRVKMTFIYQHQKSGAYDKNMNKPYLKLLERGLAQKGMGDLRPKQFLIMAERFYKSSILSRK